MTPADLKKSALMSDHVVLICPRKTAPRGETVRLGKTRGPMGRIFQVKPVDSGFHVVACFASTDILKFLAAGDTQCLKPLPPTL